MDFCHVQAAAESVDFADYRRGSFPADVVSAGCMAPFDGADINQLVLLYHELLCMARDGQIHDVAN